MAEQLAIAPALAQPSTEPTELSVTLGEMLSLLAQCEEPEDSEEAAALDEDVKANVAQAVTHKLRRYQGFLSFCDAQASECDQEIKRLQARRAAIKSGRERLRKYLARAMAGHGIKRLDAGTVVFTLMPPKPSVLVTDAEKLPYQFREERIVVDVNTQELKRALESGQDIPGAELVVGEPFVMVR